MISPELVAPFQMGVLFLLIVVALTVLAFEAVSIELTAMAVISTFPFTPSLCRLRFGSALLALQVR